MTQKRTTFTELIVKGLILFSIFTVIQGLPMFDGLNRIWMALVSVALVFRIKEFKYTAKQFWILALTVLIHAVALYFTEFPLVHVNMLFYFLLWVLIYVFFSKGKDKILKILEKSDAYINSVLWVWTILVGVSAFIPFCYDGNYFVSFAGNSFRLMPSVLIITALAMYMAVSRGRKKYNLFLILPTYEAFMNHSRTYFGVYFLFLLMYVYMEFKSKKVFFVMMIPVGAILIGLMMATGIADKIVATMYTESSYFDFWGTITSGRTIFWKHDMEAFFELPIWQQFVGNGFNFVYDVNRKNFAEIWAHNDIINILMNFGYIGALIYCWVFMFLIKTFGLSKSKISVIVKMLFLGAVFINSMFNMSYTYLCAMISYPLFLCVIEEKYKKMVANVGENNGQ